MSLHFILGGGGSGKSTWLFKKIQKDASGNPGINYLVLVPDQFTLETQKTLVSLNGNKGILNIDVLSFHRLAYRAFEEVPALRRTVLEDMGKIMILYQVFSKKKKEMLYFKRGVNPFCVNWRSMMFRKKHWKNLRRKSERTHCLA